MHFKKIKSITALALAIVTISTSFISFANDDSQDFSTNKQTQENAIEIVEGEAYAATKNDLLSNDIIVTTSDKFYQNQHVEKKSLNGTFIHNNGKPIQSDILSEKNGNELFAVYVGFINDKPFESYYFVNDTIEYIENIYGSFMRDYEKNIKPKISLMQSQKNMGSPDYFKNINYTFNAGTTTAYLKSEVDGYRRGSSIDVSNGKVYSTWDIVSLGTITNTGGRVSQQRTRIDITNFSAQNLVSYAPMGDKSSVNGNLSVSLSGAGPSINWNFPSGGDTVTMKDLSSGKYGRWEFNSKVGYQCTKIASSPGIRVRNGSGDLGVDVSHTFKLIGGDHGTGVHRIIFPDYR